MNFEQLKILVTMGEEKNFSKTANRLNMTTSAVSQSISSLEKELGIILFNRSKAGTFTTEKGQYILKEAMKILSVQNEIFRYSNDEENKKLKIKIGVIPGVNLPLIRALKKLKTNYEFLEVSIEENSTDIILKGLSEKKYNFAILSFADTIKNHNINYKPHKLLEGDFCFMINKNSLLATKSSVSFADIIKENIAIYDDKFLKNYISYIESRCTSKANIFLNSNNISYILDCVEKNIAVAPLLTFLSNKNFLKDTSKIKILTFNETESFIKPNLWFLERLDFSGQNFSKDFLNYLKHELSSK